MDAHDSPPEPRKAGLAALALLVVFALLSLSTARSLSVTTDENLYLTTGRELWTTGEFRGFHRAYQGPVGLYLNQTWLIGVEADAYADPDRNALMFRGRAGMLPWSLVALTLVYAWSRRLFGPRGALISLMCGALHPLFIGYSALINVDIAHACMTLISVYLTWRWMKQPSALRLGAAGVALGLTMATKYLAVVLAVVLFGAVAIRGLTGVRAADRSRRWLRAVGLCVGFYFATLAGIYLAYGFTDGPGVPAAGYKSDHLNVMHGIPVVSWLLTVLPQAFQIGVDHMLSLDNNVESVFYMGRYHGVSWSFYLWGFLLKTPEVILFAVLAYALTRLPRQLFPNRGSDDTTPNEGSRDRYGPRLVLASLIFPLTILSVFTSYKLGQRYVLPAYPLLFVLLGSLAELGPIARASGRTFALVLAAIALVLGVDLAVHHPNLIAYYNQSAGGGERALYQFEGSDSEYGQFVGAMNDLVEPGEELPERLGHRSGPRFGRVAIYSRTYHIPDPLDPTQSRRWLDPFRPDRRVGCAWWMWDITPERYEQAVADATDPRVRADLVLAYLGVGNWSSAREHLAQLPSELAQPLSEFGEALESAADREVPIEVSLALARKWLEDFDRADRCEALLRETGRLDDSRVVGLVAGSLIRRRRYHEAAEVLEADMSLLKGAPLNVIALAHIDLTLWRMERGIEVLDTHWDELMATQPEVAQRVRGRLEERIGQRPEWFGSPDEGLSSE